MRRLTNVRCKFPALIRESSASSCRFGARVSPRFIFRPACWHRHPSLRPIPSDVCCAPWRVACPRASLARGGGPLCSELLTAKLRARGVGPTESSAVVSPYPVESPHPLPPLNRHVPSPTVTLFKLLIELVKHLTFEAASVRLAPATYKIAAGFIPIIGALAVVSIMKVLKLDSYGPGLGGLTEEVDKQLPWKPRR